MESACRLWLRRLGSSAGLLDDVGSVPELCSAVGSSFVLAPLSLLLSLLLAVEDGRNVSGHHRENVGVNMVQYYALSRERMLPSEKRTSAPPGLLLNMPAGEGARRGRAQGCLQAQQRASDEWMVMQLAERPGRLWEACGMHSVQITGEACNQCAMRITRVLALCKACQHPPHPQFDSYMIPGIQGVYTSSAQRICERGRSPRGLSTIVSGGERAYPASC